MTPEQLIEPLPGAVKTGAVGATVLEAQDQAPTLKPDGDAEPQALKPAESPTPESPGPTATEHTPSDIPAPTSAKDYAVAAKANPVQTVALVDLWNALKSAKNTAAQVTASASQSFSAKQGASVAHDNAVRVLVARYAAATAHLGESAALDARTAFARFHDALPIVSAVFKDAGV